MRLVFMGTPEFAVPTLRAILAAGHEVAAVYTRAPASAGRGLALRPSPVQAVAEQAGLMVHTPASLRGADETASFAGLAADVAVVVAYGLILPPEILSGPRLGCLNLHGSLLPRWRGAAPLQRAIMAGDDETGVMVMRMEVGLDTGPVALAHHVPIASDMTSQELHDVLAECGAALMVRALDALQAGTLSFTPQAAEGVTYARKIDKAECRIDWRRPATDVHDHIRGLSPFPGAFFEADFGRGLERVKVLRSRHVQLAHDLEKRAPAGAILPARGGLVVACGDGAVELVTLQRAGKPTAAVADFLNGTRIPPDLRLASGSG